MKLPYVCKNEGISAGDLVVIKDLLADIMSWAPLIFSEYRL